MEESPLMPPRRRRKEEPKDQFFKLRNWLNIIFMLMAVIGVAIYLYGTKTTGIYVILISMAIKFSESALRFIR